MASQGSPVASRSLFRGYARLGLGEGPGHPISHGEQYLAADAPFAEDAELLGALRPWMTLDLDAGDHRRLGDRLEAWSVLALGKWGVVARLTPAGSYDRRVAYASHGRAYPRDELAGLHDPGAHLGRGEVFGGAPDSSVARPVEDRVAEMVRPEQVAEERKTAIALLAHLLQGLLDGRPVVFAAPVEEFVAGAPLHALVSFARAALPGPMKRSCRVRVYTRNPEDFLRSRGAHLVVVPEQAASDALGACRESILLGRDGRRMAGPEPDPRLGDYARKVTTAATDSPRALLAFATRFGERLWDGSGGPPPERAVRSVGYAYRLAGELDLPGGMTKGLLYKLRQAAARPGAETVPWHRLLTVGDWAKFPEDELLELVLSGSDGLASGLRELRASLEHALPELELDANGFVRRAWDPADDGKVCRLLELRATAPGAFAARTVAECLWEVPLERLVRLGGAAEVLEVHRAVGDLERRMEEAGRVPGLVRDPGAVDVLLRGVQEGRLTVEALGRLLRSAPSEDVGVAAPRILGAAIGSWGREPKDLAGSGGWRPVVLQVLASLRTLREIPDQIGDEMLDRVGRGLERVASEQDLELSLALRDLAIRLDPARRGDEPVRLDRLSGAADRRLVLHVATNSSWRVLGPDWLLRLDPSELVRLGLSLQPEDRKPEGCIVEALTDGMRKDAVATTGALVTTGAWLWWRRRARPGPSEEGRWACSWLTSEIWTRRDAPDPLLEDWNQVMDDLGGSLARETAIALLADADRAERALPWIRPFADRQVRELARRMPDLESLASLAERASRGGPLTAAQAYGIALDEYLVARPAVRLPGEGALRWLETNAPPESLPRPMVESLDLLLREAGSRRESLLENLARWMEHAGSVEGIGRNLLHRLDAEGGGRSGPVSAGALELARRLDDAGHRGAAELLCPDLGAMEEIDRQSRRLVEALGSGHAEDPVWLDLNRRLAEHLGGAGRGEHPLRAVARNLVDGHSKLLLATDHGETAWTTFARVLDQRRDFLRIDPRREVSLPAFDLAAALFGGLSAGVLAVRLAMLTPEPVVSRASWWRALLRGVDDCRRVGARWTVEDRPELARALLCRIRHLLPAPARTVCMDALAAGLPGAGEPENRAPVGDCFTRNGTDRSAHRPSLWGGRA